MATSLSRSSRRTSAGGSPFVESVAEFHEIGGAEELNRHFMKTARAFIHLGNVFARLRWDNVRGRGDVRTHSASEEGVEHSPPQFYPQVRVGMSYKDPRVLHLKSPADMLEVLRTRGRLQRDFKKGDTIHVWNRMEKNYSYELAAAPGRDMDPEFKPYATPAEMLAMGVFEGKYLNDCLLEFPAEWFLEAIRADKLRPTGPTVDVNVMQADSRLPLSQWRKNGWVPSGSGSSGGILADPRRNPDERGWFQWYCRYWMGRRIPDLDAEQIGRWKAFKRHAGGVRANCKPRDLQCRPRQRQALAQWAWNPFI
jgi:hypothetical protein